MPRMSHHPGWLATEIDGEIYHKFARGDGDGTGELNLGFFACRPMSPRLIEKNNLYDLRVSPWLRVTCLACLAAGL